MEREVQGFQTQILVGDKHLIGALSHAMNPIVAFTLKIWSTVVRKYKLQRDICNLVWFAYDLKFKPGMYDTAFKGWTQKGVTAICTVSEDGQFLSFQDLKTKYSLENKDFYRYLQLRDYFTKERRSNETINKVIGIVIDSYKQKGSRPISAFYRALGESRKDSTLNIKAEWEAELKIQIQEEEWYHMCETQCTSTNSLIWREFCWKNLTRSFITPKIKSRQLAVQQDCWRLCGSTEADHAHIFWNCIKMRIYWQNVNSVVKNVLGYEIPNTCLVMYLGNIEKVVMNEDLYLTKVLLAASKKAVTRNWLNVNAPNQEQWLGIVQEIHVMEKLTYLLRLKVNVFERNWEYRLRFFGC